MSNGRFSLSSLYYSLVKSSSPWKRFFIIECVIVSIFGLGLFYGILLRTENMINEDILQRARSYFTQIVITRKWNADYGGVYVVKGPGVISNPYLKNPDLRAADGRILTLRNPALMTREISQIAETKGLFNFHITSLNPLNPDNKADQFEADALRSFEKGEIKEAYSTEKKESLTVFRYIAPLITEQSCLKCHAEQHYKVGDIRGGISVQFDISPVRAVLVNQAVSFAVFILTLLSIVLIFIYQLIRRLRKQLMLAEERIRLMAVTDELTGMYNRRYFMERFKQESARLTRLTDVFSVALIDIDYFKNINDTFGHLVGDTVLQEAAKRIKSALRTVDISARYGGEEFSVIFPGTQSIDSFNAAERIRLAFIDPPVYTVKGTDIRITVSIGIVTANKEMVAQDSDTGLCTLKNADEALYRAKHNGRNRVEVAEFPTCDES
jgi:diguanylate cyclase (GGDEF)-like protein